MADSLHTDSFIVVEGLSKSVPDLAGNQGQGGSLAILSDVHLQIARAQSVAIVGASGSGKSTLLGLMAGLDVPSAGRVLVDGVDIFALDEDGRAAWRAASVGFVFQNFQLMQNMTAWENVMLPLELAAKKDAAELARAMLNRVGLGQRLHHYPKLMSGGEQQRVAIARAFVVQPALLLADEPTGSLDFATGALVMDLMFAMQQEWGTTLVLVTHDRDIAARCSRSIVVEAGRVRAEHNEGEGGRL